MTAEKGQLATPETRMQMDTVVIRRDNQGVVVEGYSRERKGTARDLQRR
jgi:hypothetical protein